jgi:hypothetical protein
MDDAPLKLYPAWRQAEADLLSSGLTYGAIIMRETLEEAFGIKPAKTIQQHINNELIYLRQSSALRDSLLENRKMMLIGEPGVGFRVVMPEEQTKLAMHRRTREVKAAMQKLVREVTNVDTKLLTDDQRKENADAQAQIGALRTMFRKQLKS